MLNLLNYYTIIKDKIYNNDFDIILSNKYSREECINNLHLEAINYLQYEFMLDRCDKRINIVFDHVCIPNNINNNEIDINFSNYSVFEFIKEIMKLKD